ncbi:MAG TPA: rhomboid family intramembrane serine protease [Candidatus Angelobacter sp.]|nr:rhomboid family intramembrane serine protease [Candidatus Angelobacter sp.]
MPSCLKCGTALAVNEEGVAPVLCDRCAGVATGRARRSMAMGGMGHFPATTLLLAINILAYLVDMVPGVNLTEWGVNSGPLTLSGQYWRLFTAGFLHAGIVHLGFNMWCLWSLGRLSERLFGKWQTFAIYMVTGVGGALLSIAYNSGRAELGASGAIFGLGGAVLAGVKFGDLNISAGEKQSIFSSVVIFAVLSFTLGMRGGTDNMCHLGGFVTGLLIGLPMGAFARTNKMLQLGTLVIVSAVIAAGARELVQTNGADAQKIAAQIAWQRRDYAQAARLLEKYTVAKPEDDEGFLMLAAAYENNNQTEKAIGVLEQAVKVNPNSEAAKHLLEELKPPTSPEKK